MRSLIFPGGKTILIDNVTVSVKYSSIVQLLRALPGIMLH